MKSFEYYNPAKIIFGVGSQNKLKNLLEAEGVTSLLLVYSGEYIRPPRSLGLTSLRVVMLFRILPLSLPENWLREVKRQR